MAKTRFITIFGLAILFAVLVTVFVRVLELRFSTGDIYPHYSTLRSDPLGAMAIYESFDSLDKIAVSRNFDNLMAIDSIDGDTTLFLCGLGRKSFERLRAPEESPVLQAVKNEGARLVMVLNPQLVPAKFDLEDKEEGEWLKKREDLREKVKAEKKDQEKKAQEKNTGDETEEEEDEEDEGKEKEDDEDETEEEETESEIEKLREEFERAQEKENGPRLTELLEIGISAPDTFERPESGWELEAGEKAPAVLPLWYSQYRFNEPGDEWSIIARVDGEPVVVERPLGKGTVVLTSDAYFASNEALWLGAEAPFLLWLAGGKSKLIFDETIHGSNESSGVIKLLRQYQLHGFFLGLLIFVILLAWKSGTSLAPGNESVERGLVGAGGAVAGEESDSGLVRLLRRSIRPREILDQCLQVHRGQSGAAENGSPRRREHSGQAAAIDQVLARHRDQPEKLGAVEAYRQITQILAQPDAYQRENESSVASETDPPGIGHA